VRAVEYDLTLVQRIRCYFSNNPNVVEHSMFWGLGFILSGHVVVGAHNTRLMARVGADHYDRALKNRYTSIIDFTSRPLKGFVYVEPEGIDTDVELHKWIHHCENVVKRMPPKKSAYQETTLERTTA
jgi:hypothetical protein